MKKYFSFTGTINGNTFFLRILFKMLLKIPFWYFLFTGLGIAVATTLGYTLEDMNDISMQNEIQIKMTEMMANDPLGFFNALFDNYSMNYIYYSIAVLIPALWFYYATYFKRISALFTKHNLNILIGFIAFELISIVIAFKYPTVIIIYLLGGLAFFITLLSMGSKIDEHDG